MRSREHTWARTHAFSTVRSSPPTGTKGDEWARAVEMHLTRIDTHEEEKRHEDCSTSVLLDAPCAV